MCDVKIALGQDGDETRATRSSVVSDVSASKTDAEARGCRLRLRCTCILVKGALPFNAEVLLCPTCCTVEYARHVHGKVGAWNDKTTFFLCESGALVTAKAVARMLALLDKCYNIRSPEEAPPSSSNPRPPVWGTHSLRRSGARCWFRAGLDVPSLKILGRWSSDAVELYIAGMLRDINLQRQHQNIDATTVTLLKAAETISLRLNALSGQLERLVSVVSAVETRTCGGPETQLYRQTLAPPPFPPPRSSSCWKGQDRSPEQSSISASH